MFGETNVWLVSKAGPRMRRVTRKWLSLTRFCREREEEKLLCGELGIMRLVDDRSQVMQVLRGTVPNLILFTPPEEKKHAPGYVRHAGSWREVLEAIAATTDPGRRAGICRRPRPGHRPRDQNELSRRTRKTVRLSGPLSVS